MEDANGERRIRQLEDAIRDIDAHATALGEDKDGFVAGGYAITVGSLHRALALVGTAARTREHAVWIETQHGPACGGCEQIKHVALSALARGGTVPSGGSRHLASGWQEGREDR